MVLDTPLVEGPSKKNASGWGQTRLSIGTQVRQQSVSRRLRVLDAGCILADIGRQGNSIGRVELRPLLTS